VVLFVGGSVVAVLTFPKALDFLLSVGGESLDPFLSAGSYLSLFFLMVVSFGVAFEFPILVTFLLLARVLTTRQLRGWRRYAFLAIVIVAAIITPSQDPITLFALALPMYFLYEGAIVVGRFLHR
jgi:sec-independent protein translocase protein TatC